MIMSSLPVAKGWLRRGAKALVSFTWPVLLTIVLAVIFMTAIVHFFGDIEQFREWQKAHYNYMLAWRLSLYAAIGLGWYRLRRTLKQRASDTNLFPLGTSSLRGHGHLHHSPFRASARRHCSGS
ncbi:hypothetical protein ALQ62_05229 [Pseudomonas coronafaciens pv. zizaniae]|nr:Uncharacterized protein ALO38_05427 [Pseudomonas coronafaciens pv. zizaniae]RMN24422.1 hypothetical protein ALQ62_05229 [Pseudomonas coronafaciens pv. zizaniae]